MKWKRQFLMVLMKNCEWKHSKTGDKLKCKKATKVAAMESLHRESLHKRDKLHPPRTFVHATISIIHSTDSPECCIGDYF